MTEAEATPIDQPTQSLPPYILFKTSDIQKYLTPFEQLCILQLFSEVHRCRTQVDPDKPGILEAVVVEKSSILYPTVLELLLNLQKAPSNEPS